MKTRYACSETISVLDLPPLTEAVRVRDALGNGVDQCISSGVQIDGLPPATYRLQAIAQGEILAQTHFVIGRWPGESHVPAFATSLEDLGSTNRTIAWLRRMRATLVQVYDWMQSYTLPIPTTERYQDPLGRSLSRQTLYRLNQEITALGATPQAYAPVYAVDRAYALAHPDQILFQNDGRMEHLGDLLTITDPASSAWQTHWLEHYGQALEELGFEAFHLDTYGYPRAAHAASGRPRAMSEAYLSFMHRVRAAHPGVYLTFNQVNGQPGSLPVPDPPAGRYVEVWAPNVAWRHLEDLLRRVGPHGAGSPIVAIYPTCWGQDRAGALRSVARTLAMVTMLGADAMMLGDQGGVLADPYYPNYVALSPAEQTWLLRWHDLCLDLRDLFRRGEDTSWLDLTGEGGGVEIDTPLAVHPEPLAQSICARVHRGAGWLALGLLNLTGSPHGLWSETVAEADPTELTVRVLLPEPAACKALWLTLDHPPLTLASQPVPSERGTLLQVQVPACADWGTLLFRTKDAML